MPKELQKSYAFLELSFLEKLNTDFNISKILPISHFINQLEKFYNFFHGLPKFFILISTGNRDLFTPTIVNKYARKLEKTVLKFIKSHKDLKENKKVEMHFDWVYINWKFVSNELKESNHRKYLEEIEDIVFKKMKTNELDDILDIKSNISKQIIEISQEMIEINQLILDLTNQKIEKNEAIICEILNLIMDFEYKLQILFNLNQIKNYYQFILSDFNFDKSLIDDSKFYLSIIDYMNKNPNCLEMLKFLNLKEFKENIETKLKLIIKGQNLKYKTSIFQ